MGGCGVGGWVWCGCWCAMHEHSPLTQLTSLGVQVSMLKGRTQSGAVFVHCQAITHERCMTLHGKPSHACTAAVHRVDTSYCLRPLQVIGWLHSHSMW